MQESEREHTQQKAQQPSKEGKIKENSNKDNIVENSWYTKIQ